MADEAQSTTWRWILAGLIIVGALVVSFLGWLESCTREAVVTDAGVEVVDVCTAASMLDPRYLLALLVAGILVWPDLAEITVGSFSLKRRLEKAEDEQKELKGQLEQLSISMQSNQTMTVNVPYYADIEAVIQQAVEAGLKGVDISPTEDGEPIPRPTYADAQYILRTWERLRLFHIPTGRVPDSLEFLVGRSPSSAARFWANQVAEAWPEAIGRGAAMVAEQARVFSSNFPDTLDLVLAMRNAIAHGKPVSDDDLAAAVKLASGLEGFLLDRFSAWAKDDQGKDIGLRIGEVARPAGGGPIDPRVVG